MRTYSVLSLREVEAGQTIHREGVVEVCGGDVGGPLDEVDFGFVTHNGLGVVDEDSESML